MVVVAVVKKAKISVAGHFTINKKHLMNIAISELSVHCESQHQLPITLTDNRNQCTFVSVVFSMDMSVFDLLQWQ